MSRLVPAQEVAGTGADGAVLSFGVDDGAAVHRADRSADGAGSGVPLDGENARAKRFDLLPLGSAAQAGADDAVGDDGLAEARRHAVLLNLAVNCHFFADGRFARSQLVLVVEAGDLVGGALSGGVEAVIRATSHAGAGAERSGHADDGDGPQKHLEHWDLLSAEPMLV